MHTFYHRSDYVFPSPTGRRRQLRNLDRLRYKLGVPLCLSPLERVALSRTILGCSAWERGEGPCAKSCRPRPLVGQT